jgi:hypothetical protein
MATALLMMTLGGSWLTVRNQLLQHGLEQARIQKGTERQELRQRIDQLASQLEQRDKQSADLEKEIAALALSNALSKSPQAAAFILAFAPIPGGGVRDAAPMNKVAISPGVRWLQVQLDLEMGDYPRYQAVLRNAEGDEIWRQSAQKVRAPGAREGVVLALPAGLFSRGDYILKLSGIDPHGKVEDMTTYQFSVTRK